MIWNTTGRSDLVEITSLVLNTFKTIDLCHLRHWKIINGFTLGGEDDTTLTVESEEELESLDEGDGESKSWLKNK